ncbi:hypothetical protein HYDPIDRAFT_112150 [Hydnomerulius pinastri MD-312]|uniref:Uncharacterized protein n=1 Tax=Hydnomerulius pinastri MD-312 TaxID=994086 RepID=A0A0C9VFE0_9AGAM|nr:hypothetical protein HYDPIDRAFT_112150 [Hydnomerulius pinastri MD-312]
MPVLDSETLTVHFLDSTGSMSPSTSSTPAVVIICVVSGLMGLILLRVITRCYSRTHPEAGGRSITPMVPPGAGRTRTRSTSRRGNNGVQHRTNPAATPLRSAPLPALPLPPLPSLQLDRQDNRESPHSVASPHHHSTTSRLAQPVRPIIIHQDAGHIPEAELSPIELPPTYDSLQP